MYHASIIVETSLRLCVTLVGYASYRKLTHVIELDLMILMLYYLS